MSVDMSELKNRYANMKTAELIHLKKSGGLTEDAVVLLKAELDSRTIDEGTLDDVTNLSEADVATNDSDFRLYYFVFKALIGIFTVVLCILLFLQLTEGQQSYVLLLFIVGGPLYIIQAIYRKIKKRKKSNRSNIAVSKD